MLSSLSVTGIGLVSPVGASAAEVFAAIKLGIRGYASSIGTACAAGAQSIGEALRILRADEADIVLCGCVEAPLFPTFADAFGNARALAHGRSDPTADI